MIHLKIKAGHKEELKIIGDAPRQVHVFDDVSIDAVNAAIAAKRPLLVVITTNEERALPDAFLRRCLVLQLKLEDGKQLVDFFVRRGKAHFGDDFDEDVLREAAEQVKADREHWQEKNLAAPGLAEFLDLIRAVSEQTKKPDEQKKLLKRIKRFMLKKHPEGAA
ncbi:MAG: hypothetical protein ACE5I1_06385 [bacterium]